VNLTLTTDPSPHLRYRRADLLGLGFCVLVYLAHSFAFRHWIVDDAGISFVDARNLANGHGLVSQPGVPPVEGYSNFLWVVLLAMTYKLDVFDPYLTPKALAALFVIAAFIVAHRTTLRLMRRNSLLALFGPLMLALNTSIIVWTNSGLENALSLFFLSVLLGVTTHSVLSERPSFREASLAASTSAALGMTRPDLAIFAVVWPLLVLLLSHAGAPRPGRRGLLAVSAYGAVFAVIFGGFLLFRWNYFHALWPNSYYAKGTPPLSELLAVLTFQPQGLAKVGSLLARAYGATAFPAIVLLVAVATALVRKRCGGPEMVIGAFLLAGLVDFAALTNDWMGECRFATPFLLFLYPFTALLFLRFFESLPIVHARDSGLLVAATLLAVVATSAPIFGMRSVLFSRQPTVPFEVVREQYGRRYDAIAARLGLGNASVLLPDVGATLYYSSLTVFDLAGLTDSEIARSLVKDPGRFYRYVFEAAKPTFIHVRAPWTGLAAFERDLRFRRDYVPLSESVDESVGRDSGATVYSGDFIRRDALDGREGQLVERGW
jgi:hypothetical protein